MKKIIVFLLLINFFSAGHSQIIRGTILDKTNDIKINFASIYISGTYVGTNSDQYGYFELDLKNYTSLPITISALGYYSVTLTDFSREKPIVAYLTPRVIELKEVVIVAKSLAKEKENNLKLFRKEFLGTTNNAQRCIIINVNDILFNNGSSDDTLKAFASNPIIIYNNDLGYKITYYLDKFEYYKKNKSFLYEGSAVFNEDLTSDLTQKKFFERRRKYAYLGSRSHFFNSLWENNLKLNGFIVKNSADEILNYEDIVIERDGNIKYLAYNDNLYIYYISKTPNGYIEFHKDTVFFDRNGYFDGSGVRVIGQMASQRIGDLLPYDYQLSISRNDTIHVTQSTKTNEILNVFSSPVLQACTDSLDKYIQMHQEYPQEKIFVHLDRSDYIPGDTLWFKAYLWYGYDQVPDTISGILHVDLINTRGDVIMKRKLLIQNGSSHGDFALDSTIIPGRYTILAYTRLIQDLNSRAPFYKTLNIHPRNENFHFECTPSIIMQSGNDSLKIGMRFFEVDQNGDFNANYNHVVNYSLRIGDLLLTDSILAINTRNIVLKFSLAGINRHDSIANLVFSIKDNRLVFEKLFHVPLGENIDLQFFPEGGKLVSGLESKIAFKAIGLDGLGREIAGEIRTDDEKVVTEFRSTHKGMGTFMLKPQGKMEYFAHIWYNNQKYIIPLPHISEKGTVMSVSFAGNNTGPLVSIKQKIPREITPKYIIGSSYGKIWFSALLKSFKDSCELQLPMDLLPEGVCRLTVLNSGFEPECERLIYVNKNQRFKIEVLPDSASYGTRSRVTLLLKATSPDGEPVQTDLSIAVLDKEQITRGFNVQSINAYRLLESELKGYIEDAGSYFKDDSIKNLPGLDLLMLTHGYRSFLSNKSNSDKENFNPEKNLFISGELKLIGNKSEKNKFNYRDINLTLISVAEKPFFGLMHPDSVGRFKFQLPLMIGEQHLMLQARTSKNKPFIGDILIDSPVSPVFNTLPPVRYNNPLFAMEYMSGRQDIKKTETLKISQKGSISKTLGEVVVTAKADPKNWWRNFDKDAFQRVNLDSLDPKGDRYKDIYDLLVKEFGAIPFNAGFLRTVFFPCNQIINLPLGSRHKPTLAFWPPIYVVDGKTYWNGEGFDFKPLNSLSAFPVNEIKKILVVPPMKSIVDHYAYELIRGHPNYIYQSMVVIETYSKNTYRGDLQGVNKFIMDGLDVPRVFYSPRYDGLSRNGPVYDSRPTLYWEPSIWTDDSGEARVVFFTSDRHTGMEVIVKGIEVENGYSGEGRVQINLSCKKLKN